MPAQTATPSNLPKGRQPPAYEDSALRGYLQAQWDAHHRVPTYAELQRGDPDNDDVPRFAGSLTRLVRLRRAFLAEVDPTCAMAGQVRLSKVEAEVRKNTARTQTAIEILEQSPVDQAVRNLERLTERVREQLRDKERESRRVAEALEKLNRDLAPMLRAFAKSGKKGPSRPPVEPPAGTESPLAGLEELVKRLESATQHKPQIEASIDQGSLEAALKVAVERGMEIAAKQPAPASSVIVPGPDPKALGEILNAVSELSGTVAAAERQSLQRDTHLANAIRFLGASQGAQVDLIDAETQVILEAIQEVRQSQAKARNRSHRRRPSAPKRAPTARRTKAGARRA